MAARLLAEDGSRFEVLFDGIVQGEVDWPLTGLHNVANALASLAAARHVGVMPSQARRRSASSATSSGAWRRSRRSGA